MSASVDESINIVMTVRDHYAVSAKFITSHHVPYDYCKRRAVICDRASVSDPVAALDFKCRVVDNFCPTMWGEHGDQHHKALVTGWRECAFESFLIPEHVPNKSHISAESWSIMKHREQIEKISTRSLATWPTT